MSVLGLKLELQIDWSDAGIQCKANSYVHLLKLIVFTSETLTKLNYHLGALHVQRRFCQMLETQLYQNSFTGFFI